MEDLSNFIGHKVDLVNGAQTTVKYARLIGDIWVFTSEDGEIFTEDDIDFRYKVTPFYLLFCSLQKEGVVKEDDWDGDTYERIYNHFMSELESCGYIVKSE